MQRGYACAINPFIIKYLLYDEQGKNSVMIEKEDGEITCIKQSPHLSNLLLVMVHFLHDLNLYWCITLMLHSLEETQPTQNAGGYYHHRIPTKKHR